jgi:hypothetical protein
MHAVTRDWADFGGRPAVRRNAGWYLLSLLAYPAAMLATIFIGSVLSVREYSGLHGAAISRSP